MTVTWQYQLLQQEDDYASKHFNSSTVLDWSLPSSLLALFSTALKAS